LTFMARDGGVTVTGETPRGSQSVDEPLGGLAAHILAASCAHHRLDLNPTTAVFTLVADADAPPLTHPDEP
jgi:hypothetical protein